MRRLDADGLSLEPQTAAHAEAMYAVLCDPAIYAHENAPPPSLEWLRQRYAALESRCSPDGREQWLNWVVRLPGGEPIGYVQATLHDDGRAAIAYEFGSAWWGRGLARRAVEAMLAELAAAYGVRRATALLKQGNARSRRLLERLGFAPAPPGSSLARRAEADELAMWRELAPGAARPAVSAPGPAPGTAP